MKPTQKYGALHGLRVLDLTQMLAGPFCTQMLADHGAEVVKVETLTGDGIRTVGPFPEGDELQAFGGYFQSVNRNKESLALDLKSPQGKEVFLRLVRDVDIVVENFRSGVMERLGLGYEVLQEINPALVYGAIRGFGDPRSGNSPYADWPAYDVVAQAMGGIMGITGPDEHSPTKIGPGVGDTVPALMLCVGILAAVHHAQKTGEGQFVDVAMTDAVLALCERIVYQKSYANVTSRPEGNKHPLLSPFGLFRAQDGWISIACAHDQFWVKLAEAIGRPEIALSPTFATTQARVANIDAVTEAIEGFTLSRTKAEIAKALGGKVPFGPVYTADDVFSDPHFQVREMIVDIEQPGVARPVQVAGVPIKLSRTPGQVRSRAPLLGEHTRRTLTLAGYSPEAIDRMYREGAIL